MTILSQITRSLTMVVMSVLLVSCMTARDPSRHVATTDVSSEGVGLINAFRAENGLKPVTVDADLVRMAERQVVAMASRDLLSHEVDGDFVSRMNAAGYARVAGAENVGAGHATVQNAIQSWIASPHHRENMLMKDATRIGLVRGAAPWSRYRSYWALELASGPANGVQVAGFPRIPSLSSLWGQ